MCIYYMYYLCYIYTHIINKFKQYDKEKMKNKVMKNIYYSIISLKFHKIKKSNKIKYLISRKPQFKSDHSK